MRKITFSLVCEYQDFIKPDETIGTLNGWHNIETQLKYQLYVNPEHET
jgi:hypothetical protein